MAFAGSLAAVLLVYAIARTGGRVSISSLLLVGIAVSSFLASIVSLLMVISEDRMHNIFFWLMGGISTGDWGQVAAVAPFILAGAAVTLFYSRDLNLILLGEERAAQLGLRTDRFKWVMIVTASLMVGAAVSVSGIIGFVGLITPHIVRLMTGPDHRYLVPGSLLAGRLLPGAGRHPGTHPHRPQRTAGGHSHRILRRPLLHLPAEDGGRPLTSRKGSRSCRGRRLEAREVTAGYRGADGGRGHGPEGGPR